MRTTDRTGVEMEALTAVAVAGLTLHDMVKAVDPAARARRGAGRAQGRRQDRHLDPPERPVSEPTRTARVITASNRAAAGVYAGPQRAR